MCEVGFTEEVYTAAESVGDREVCLMKTNAAILIENIDVQISATPIIATAEKDSAQGKALYWMILVYNTLQELMLHARNCLIVSYCNVYRFTAKNSTKFVLK